MKPKNKDLQYDYEVHIVGDPDKIDLTYEYLNHQTKKKWSLQKQLQNYITKKLRKGLSFKYKANGFQILLDQKIKKTGQTGSFQFDPFAYSVKIYLTNTMGDQFCEYKLGQEQTILFNDPKEDLPKEEQDQITDDTTMDQLMDKIGKVLDIQTKRLNMYKDNFRSNFIRKVSDIKSWKEEQIIKSNSFPVKVLKMVYEASNKIDYYSEKIFTSKKLQKNKEIMQCAKLGNSHKVLRYCIFKNNPKELQQVSYLNSEAIKKSLDLINKELKFQDRIQQDLKDFLNQFALQHDSGHIYSRGAIFNGPPGTGKTMITELLMFLCGFSLISEGKSASDFSKSYVGEAGRMIYELFSRADCCPYLACSIAIDEIEGAFPNRNDSSEKNKGEVTSQFLSVIEGNKNIKNLFILSSTNHIDKIDSAALRRLGDRIDLPRLNNSDREKILQEFLTKSQLSKIYLQRNQKHKQMILNLTMNFTGAAFKKLLSQFEDSLRNQKLILKMPQIILDDSQVENIISKIARDYKIIFGSKTLPQLVRSNKIKRKHLTKQFLQRIQCHFMFLTTDSKSISSQITLGYINRQNDKEGKLIRELKEIKFNTELQLKRQDRLSPKKFASFFQKQILHTFDCEVEIFDSSQALNKAFNQVIADSKKPKIFLITNQVQKAQWKNAEDLLKKLKCFNQDKENVYVFYVSVNFDASNVFGMIKSKKNYSGRIIAEIGRVPRIIFQLKHSFLKENSVYIQNHFSSGEVPRPDDLVPNIIQFFNKRKVSNIFMIDNYYLEAKNAFSSQKELQAIRSIVEEAKMLTNVALIFNFDSLLISSKIDNQQNGREYFQISNNSLYRALVNACRQFYSQEEKVQNWIVIFVKNNSLLRKIRQDIYWPQMPEEAVERRKQQQLNRKRTCYRCGQIYTQKQNQQQKKCAQHPGILINTILKQTTLIDLDLAMRQNQLQELRKNMRENKNIQYPNYIYSCCLQNVKEIDNYCSKKNLFRHIEKNQRTTSSDELHQFQSDNFVKWEQNFLRFRKQQSQNNGRTNNTANISSKKKNQDAAP